MVPMVSMGTCRLQRWQMFDSPTLWQMNCAVEYAFRSIKHYLCFFFFLLLALENYLKIKLHFILRPRKCHTICCASNFSRWAKRLSKLHQLVQVWPADIQISWSTYLEVLKGRKQEDYGGDSPGTIRHPPLALGPAAKWNIDRHTLVTSHNISQIICYVLVKYYVLCINQILIVYFLWHSWFIQTVWISLKSLLCHIMWIMQTSLH